MRRKFIYLIVVVLIVLGIFLSQKMVQKLNTFKTQWDELRSQVEQLNYLKQLPNQVNFLVDEVFYTPKPENILEDQEPQGNTFVFLGHIYPFNGNNTEISPRYPDTGKTMREFLTNMNRLNPKRVIFGGDTIFWGSEKRLLYLRDRIVGKLQSPSRLVIGNHELNGKGVMAYPQLFSSLYNQPFYFEDVDGVRLIYLNSMTPEKKNTLEDEQIKFLSQALSGKDYDVAMVFLHSALWLAGSEYSNFHYPPAEETLSLWKEKVLPLLTQGKVKAVFAGDGGIKHQSVVTELEGIPHYLTGWPFDLQQLPADFLRIEVVDDEVNVYRYVTFEKKPYRVPLEKIDRQEIAKNKINQAKIVKN